ncbi:uncharacterized protein [Choristoneura fumiferana]|uniref:uncharacterized protein n=1 Tax=Choristoneura fumiferana TaxID=7141 RepID=UPI003D156AAC
MRAPGGVQRKREKQREDNIPTMVEAVEVNTPSHMSREDTPRISPHDSPRAPPRRSKNNTPRGIRKSRNTSPRLTRSPPRMHMNQKLNVSSQELKLALNSVKVTSDISLSPAAPDGVRSARSPKSGREKPQSPDKRSPHPLGGKEESLDTQVSVRIIVDSRFFELRIVIE